MTCCQRKQTGGVIFSRRPKTVSFNMYIFVISCVHSCLSINDLSKIRLKRSSADKSSVYIRLAEQLCSVGSIH